MLFLLQLHCKRSKRPCPQSCQGRVGHGHWSSQNPPNCVLRQGKLRRNMGSPVTFTAHLNPFFDQSCVIMWIREELRVMVFRGVVCQQWTSTRAVSFRVVLCADICNEQISWFMLKICIAHAFTKRIWTSFILSRSLSTVQSREIEQM